MQTATSEIPEKRYGYNGVAIWLPFGFCTFVALVFALALISSAVGSTTHGRPPPIWVLPVAEIMPVGCAVYYYLRGTRECLTLGPSSVSWTSAWGKRVEIAYSNVSDVTFEGTKQSRFGMDVTIKADRQAIKLDSNLPDFDSFLMELRERVPEDKRCLWPSEYKGNE